MLPTPSTSHVNFSQIYEPAEDSYLLLDTLSSPSETTFLSHQFPSSTPSPLILEVGTGSGVVLSFVHSNAGHIFGREDFLTMGVDINPFACQATRETIAVAEKEKNEKAEGEEKGHGFYLGNIQSDLTTSLTPSTIDILIFNPPYVPTDTLPSLPHLSSSTKVSFKQESELLALSYAGGKDGMMVTDRLLDSLPEVLSKRGVGYVLLCAQNRPGEIIEGIRGWEGGEGWKWEAEIVGRSGKKAGWEKLVIVRIWRVQRFEEGGKGK